MTDLLQENEATPASYPATPSGLSIPGAALDAEMIWERIEAYTPLSPIASHTAEKWENGAWVSTALPDGPVGLCLPSDGVFKVTAQVGDGTPPKAVSEAFRRLAEYMADDTDRAGVSSYSVNMGGAIQESYQRNAAHAARALENSGAADMLRPYRRQK